MKVYVVGPELSGKEVFAKKVAEEYGVSCYQLDKGLSKGILNEKGWVIEGTGSEMNREGLEAADLICYMKVSKIKIYYLIIKRWIVQRIKKEQGFKPPYKVLKDMFRRAKKDLDRSILNELKNYGDKLKIIK